MNPKAPRRSFVLAATLVAIVLLALSAIGIAVIADVQSDGVDAESRRVQARALAWSGVQCVMAELARQRPRMMEAQPPQIATSWTMFERDGGAGDRGIARLVDRSGQLLIPEAGRLDLNAATRDQLVALGVEPEQADRVISGRSAGPYASPVEVGILRAPSAEVSSTADTEPSDPVALLTTFAFEPNVQVGIGPGAAVLAGRPRIDISAPWSDQLGSALTERLGAELAAPLLEQLRTKGPTKRYSDLVRWLVARGPETPVADWGAYFDVVTTSDAPLTTGAIDINTAPPEVLAAVPGLDPDAAERIALRRRSMEPSLRRSVTWPLTEKLITPEQFADMVDHVTIRSLVWRVVVEAGVSSGKIDPDGSDPLSDRVCYEAVIDLVDPTPRLAYLRDITELDHAASADLKDLAVTPDSDEEPRSAPSDIATVPDSPPITAEPPPRPAAPRPTRPSPKKPDSSNTSPAHKPTSARIGRWTAGAGGRAESENDAATPSRDQP